MGRKRGWSAVARGCAAAVLAVACAGPAMGAQHRHVAAARHHKVTLAATIQTLLAEPKIEGAHWGISVTGLDGSPVYALNDGKLFQPASNVKLFTTAAALEIFGEKKTWKTTASIDGCSINPTTVSGDITILGEGDVFLSDRIVPYAANVNPALPTLGKLDQFIAQISQKLTKSGITTVEGDVVSMDRYPWQPYGQGWNTDDLVWGYGAPVTGTVISDNQLQLSVKAGSAVGKPAMLSIAPNFSYYTLKNEMLTTPAGTSTRIDIERDGRVLRVYGGIGLDAKSDTEEIAIDDPALYTALALRASLKQQGITVTGSVRADRHYSSDARSVREIENEPLDLVRIKNLGPGWSSSGPEGGVYPAPACTPFHARAEHVSPSLIDDVRITNKVSQNLHAEILLRKLAAWEGASPYATFAQGARVVRQFAINAGVRADDFYFVDGSGLSTYDVATPRAFTTLLRYAAAQPWGADWRSSLPVGGVDGTLEHRFTKSPVTGKVFAKTGTLSEDRALSGYLVCASGKTVVFSILVGNHLPGSHEDRDVMDKIVEAIAAAN
ncbi:MAG: D-alanyl-D-alanine carboxypeptidase/D-alanyl-D-alanine-endopeptidase [Acidobacteriaceae bacterium]|nr:D-alanyl-D-alanine carboxypeptidase/D-alanyl-D-alanine-endopeptidase [Acidobacteriaceae bacterium]